MYRKCVLIINIIGLDKKDALMLLSRTKHVRESDFETYDLRRIPRKKLIDHEVSIHDRS